MDWDHFRVFLAVARSGQLSAAARRLGVNHTTVARRLDAMEAELGATLFERRPTGCVLTEAGERLIPLAERIESGNVWVNETRHLSPFVAFAGHKQSGFGVENGQEGLLEYLLPKTITRKRAPGSQ